MTDSTIKIGSYSRTRSLLDVKGHWAHTELYVLVLEIDAPKNQVVKKRFIKVFLRRAQANAAGIAPPGPGVPTLEELQNRKHSRVRKSKQGVV